MKARLHRPTRDTHPDLWAGICSVADPDGPWKTWEYRIAQGEPVPGRIVTLEPVNLVNTGGGWDWVRREQKPRRRYLVHSFGIGRLGLNWVVGRRLPWDTAAGGAARSGAMPTLPPKPPVASVQRAGVPARTAGSRHRGRRVIRSCEPFRDR